MGNDKKYGHGRINASIAIGHSAQASSNESILIGDSVSAGVSGGISDSTTEKAKEDDPHILGVKFPTIEFKKPKKVNGIPRYYWLWLPFASMYWLIFGSKEIDKSPKKKKGDTYNKSTKRNEDRT